MATAAANPPRERKPCIAPHADIVKDDALWNRCEYVGVREDYDDAGNRADLALANCTCGSTLSRPVRAPKRNPIPPGATIWFGRENYATVELAVAAAIDAIDRSRGGRRNQPRIIEVQVTGDEGIHSAENIEVARVVRHATRQGRYVLEVLDPEHLPADVWTMNGNGGTGSRVRGLVGVVAAPGVTHPDDAQPTAAHAPYVFNVDTDWDPPITSFYTAVADAIARLRSSSDTTPVEIEYGERQRDARGNEHVEPLGVVAWVAPFDAAYPNLLRLFIEHPGLVPGDVTTGDADERARKMRQWRGCRDVHSVDVQWSPRAAGALEPTVAEIQTGMVAHRERGLVEFALHVLPNPTGITIAATNALIAATMNEMAIRYPGGYGAIVALREQQGMEAFEQMVHSAANSAGFVATDLEARRPYSLLRPPAFWVRGDQRVPIGWVRPVEPTQLERALATAINIDLDALVDDAPTDAARQFVASVWEQMITNGVTMDSISANGAAYFEREARVAAGMTAQLSRAGDAWRWRNRRRVSGNTADHDAWVFRLTDALTADAVPAFDATVASSVTAPLVEQAVSRALGLNEHDPEPRRATRFVRAVIQRAREDVGGTLRGPFNSDDFLYVIVQAAQNIATLQRPATGLSCWVWRDPERNNEPVAILRNDAASRPGVSPHDYAQAQARAATPAAAPPLHAQLVRGRHRARPPRVRPVRARHAGGPAHRGGIGACVLGVPGPGHRPTMARRAVRVRPVLGAGGRTRRHPRCRRAARFAGLHPPA